MIQHLYHKIYSKIRNVFRVSNNIGELNCSVLFQRITKFSLCLPSRLSLIPIINQSILSQYKRLLKNGFIYIFPDQFGRIFLFCPGITSNLFRCQPVFSVISKRYFSLSLGNSVSWGKWSMFEAERTINT